MPRVLLYGTSLHMAGVHASLAGVPGLHTRVIPAEEDQLIDNVRAETPDFLVFELGRLSDQMVLTLMTRFPGMELIGVDTKCNRLLVLSVRLQPSPDTEDLVQTIQRESRTPKPD